MPKRQNGLWKILLVSGGLTITVGASILAAGELIGDIKDNTAAIEEQRKVNKRQEQLLQDQRVQSEVIGTKVDNLIKEQSELNGFLRRLLDVPSDDF